MRTAETIKYDISRLKGERDKNVAVRNKITEHLKNPSLAPSEEEEFRSTYRDLESDCTCIDEAIDYLKDELEELETKDAI